MDIAVFSHRGRIENPIDEVAVAEPAEHEEIRGLGCRIGAFEVGVGVDPGEVVAFVDFAAASLAGLVRLVVGGEVFEGDVVGVSVPDLDGGNPVLVCEVGDVGVDGADGDVEFVGEVGGGESGLVGAAEFSYDPLLGVVCGHTPG